MNKLSDKVSYLKGLAAGMKLNMDKDSNKLLVEMLGVLSETIDELQALSEAHDELNDYVESIDDDLTDLEGTLFGDEDDDEDDDDEGCGCHECAGDDEDDCIIHYACPECGHPIEFRAEDVDFNEDFLCPACGKSVFPAVDEGDEEDEEVDIDPEE